jgi:hypothetical protein
VSARRDKLKSYPAGGPHRPAPLRVGIGDHALAALESFNMAGLASCHPATVQRGIRELRALLAVARAAEAFGIREPNGFWCAVHTTEEQDQRLGRALYRLDRVSGRKP